MASDGSREGSGETGGRALGGSGAFGGGTDRAGCRATGEKIGSATQRRERTLEANQHASDEDDSEGGKSGRNRAAAKGGATGKEREAAARKQRKKETVDDSEEADAEEDDFDEDGLE
ncbi:hypothetical protein T484DRAFT_1758346, partial [Baffinella frigidus]